MSVPDIKQEISLRLLLIKGEMVNGQLPADLTVNFLKLTMIAFRIGSKYANSRIAKELINSLTVISKCWERYNLDSGKPWKVNKEGVASFMQIFNNFFSAIDKCNVSQVELADAAIYVDNKLSIAATDPGLLKKAMERSLAPSYTKGAYNAPVPTSKAQPIFQPLDNSGNVLNSSYL